MHDARPARELLLRIQRALKVNALADAESAARSALALAPDDPDARYLAAIVAGRGGRHDAALSHLAVAIDRAPMRAPLWIAFGNARDRCGDAAGAEQAYRTACGLEPGNADALFNLGIACRRRHAIDAAAVAFARALDADPMLFDAGRMLADVLAQWADADPAFRLPPVPLPVPAPAVSIVVCSIDAAKFARVRALYARLFAHVPHELIGIHDARSLTEAYARALARCAGEVVLFSHDDVDVLLPDFAARVLAALGTADVVGVVGATRASGPGACWAGHPHIHGWIAHRGAGDDGIHAGFYSTRAVVDRAVTLDGLLIAGRRRAVEAVGFDAATFDDFHLYDVDFALRAARAGLAVAIRGDLGLVHASRGAFGHAWRRQAERFRARYPDLAHAPPGPHHHYEATLATDDEARAFFARLRSLAPG